MPGPDPIRTVVVAGGGLSGWSAAAALKRHLPRLDVTLVVTPPPPDALADRIGAALPSIIGFHRDLGLGEGDTVARAGSAYRLGTLFEEWAEGLPPYVHGYGQHGQAFGTTSFHLHWLRSARAGRAAPFEAHGPAAVLGRAGRFAHVRADPGSPLATVEYGLTLNLPRYLQMMRAFALHLGVEERPGRVAGAELRAEDGFIRTVRLDDGGEAGADLFVDCTGPAAAIRSKLDSRFEEWSHWLPCDRILFAEAPPPPDLPLLDRAAAIPAGWRWESAAPARTSRGLAYSSAHLADSAAAEALPGAHSPVAIRQGRRPDPWLRNCVAVGDAAVAVEPLEWTNLHLVHSAVDRIVSMMPDRACAPVELAEYNRQCGAEADRVRDFLALHYLASSRPEPFWREAAAVPPPDSLAHTLALFRERGRLPFYEEETFSRDSWLAVLLGQGIMPRRIDPLTESVAPEAADAAMARMRAALEAGAASLPPHTAYLRNLAARAMR